MSIENFAKETGTKSGLESLHSDVEHFYPTGCTPLDIYLGGGIPSGRLVELFGWSGGGKSTLALNFTMAFSKYWKEKKEDYAILWIESESVFNRVRAKYIGCEIENFLISEHDIVENGFSLIQSVIEKAVKKNIKLFVVWDTIAATVPKVEKESGEYAGGMMLKPRIIWSALRKLIPIMGTSQTTLVLVNQVYSKVNSPGGGCESPGGGGIKFFSSIRLYINQREKVTTWLPSGKEITKAIFSELFSAKNKLAFPHQKIDIYIHGEEGFSILQTTYRFCQQNEIFKTAGGWKSLAIDKYDGTKKEDLESYSFQNIEHFKDRVMSVPYNVLYIDYRILLVFSNISPFLKVTLIDRIWKLEEELFKSRKTEISEKEFELAKLIHKEIQESESKDGSEN